jgi:HPr kinase/phosphorylase
MIVHATSVGMPAGDRTVGILLVGQSGSGKSDLALRLIDTCPSSQTRLIADDQTALRAAGDALIASAPSRIAGLLEVRGLGIVQIEHAAEADIALIVECVDSQCDLERIPKPFTKTLCGIAVPVIGVKAFEASAPAKVRLALRAVVQGLFRGDTALSEDRTI